MARWAIIKDFTRYEVSDEGGYVRRIDNGYVMTNCGSPTGYAQVHLRYAGRNKYAYVHILVLSAYVPKPSPDHEVNHLDGNKQNNSLSNLAWCTRSENIRHSFDVLGHTIRHGIATGMARFTDADIPVIRVRRAAGETLQAIASSYGTDTSTISKITRRQAWSHVA
jgi:hypothetical protein